MYDWIWTDFFKQNILPPFVIDGTNAQNCRQWFNLSFEQGLTVIVASVPKLSQNQWAEFHAQLAQYRDQYAPIDYWLLIGQMIRDYEVEVRQLLDGNVEHATTEIRRWLAQQNTLEQFALMTCLHYHAQTRLQAQLMFDYLLHHCDSRAQQVQTLLRFYQGLTERQKDVAILAAHGLTNQEIAATLYIAQSVAAEYLTIIFDKFQSVTPDALDKHGTRYRLIHWLTCLLREHPYLLDRQF